MSQFIRTTAIVAAIGTGILRTPAAEPPSGAWTAEAQKRLAEREYEITSVQGAWQAPNREQSFRTTFDGAGIKVAPREHVVKAWELGLTLTASGRLPSLTTPRIATVQVDGARITYERPGIREWYVNAPDGLEQGFKIAAPGEGARGEYVIELSLTGTLEPVRSHSEGTIALGVRGGDAVLRYHGLTVTDARGNELPSQLGAFSHQGHLGIRISFDDTGAAYPVTVDPRLDLYASQLWQKGSGQTASWFGYSVSTAGDVNGDGYDDVIVGAPLYDNGQDAEGRAYLFLGGPNGLSTTPAWTTESDQAQANYGWSVATAGDVNGDGLADVVVCSPGWNNGSGKVWVYYGQSNGLPVLPSWTKEGTQLFGSFGNVAATAGDVNGDGYADIIVGAQSESNGQSLEGRAYVFLGSASGLATTAAWIGESNQANADYGVSVASAGDVNGDGYDDVIIGADQYDNPELNEGRAYVYLGGPGGLAATPQWTAEGNQAGANFGASVAGAGDVDGDGYADVLVGAPGYDGPENAEGRVVLYVGGSGGVGGPPQWSYELHVADAHLGAAVATAGDLNGDGYADVIVGAPNFDGNAGKVLCFAGGHGGVSPNPWFTQSGASGSGLLTGISVGAADVDGDGFSDILYGAYAPASDGRAYVWPVAADVPGSSPAWVGQGGQANSNYGSAVASAGDVNGDGYSDVLVGAYRYSNGQTFEGRAYLYMGGPNGVSTIPAWTVESNVVSGQLGSSLASAGDVNGDGYADVIIAAPNAPTNTVAVYYGSAAGLPATPSWSLDGSYGAVVSVASAGDVNGDGYSDIIVGYPYYSGGQGAVQIYLGSPTGLASTAAWQIVGATPMQLGYSVASAGDVNGDGFSDVVIGAPLYSNGQAAEGKVYVYLGSPTAPMQFFWSREGNVANLEYGYSVASAGDVNGDGYSDVLTGQPYQSPPIVGPGGLWYGGPSTLTLDSAWTNTLYDVAPAGDIDQDGRGDILANGLLYLSQPDGTMLESGWTPQNGQSLPNFGQPVASAGDVNADGFPDIIVGYDAQTVTQTSEGVAQVYFGGGGGPSTIGTAKRRVPRQLQSNQTTPLSLLAKSDSPTGFHLSASAMTAAGRTRVRLIWEAKPLGTSFNAAGLGSTTTIDTGAPGPSGSFVSFNLDAPLLLAGTPYHWRERTVSANPFFPRTPWLSPVGNSPTESKLRSPGCPDADGDGHGRNFDPACPFAAVDCNDNDAGAWALPGETRNLVFTSKTTMTWSPPLDAGGTATLLYDTQRAQNDPTLSSSDCVGYHLAALTASDTSTPSLGSTIYYLNRARNSCGPGTTGTGVGGYDRNTPPCP